MTVADVGEFGLIATITAGLARGSRTIVGIGDDAAVLAVPDRRIVATTDLLVEGRHFRRDWSGPGDVGRKAAARNMADVAAMGASTVALLVGLAVPADLPAEWARELLAGLAAECGPAGAAVVGGDVSGAEAVVVSVTALGELDGAEPVTRSGARPGDVVAVAGELGRSAAGLALLSAGLDGPASLVEAHLRPRPPYRAGPEAAALGATSMIDVSDGLLADLRHVAEASGVAVELESALLKPGPELRAAAAAVGRPSAAEWVLTGGEDHALAATFPAGRTLPGHWSVIGKVHVGRGVRVDGRKPGGRWGWEHFR